MLSMRPTFAVLRFLCRVLALGVASLSWPMGEATAQNFVAVPDSTNPIVAATVTGQYTGAAWVDVDGDGLLDLFIARKATMYRNLGGGSFVAMNGAVPNQGQALGTTWADADNDGDLDVFLSGNLFLTNGSNYYRNDGSFNFTKITAGDIGNSTFNSGWGCAFGDFDDDAYADIVVAAANGFGGVTHPNRLLKNNGDGSFTNIASTAITDSLDAHTVPTWSDYDQDGDIDLFIGSGEVSQLSPDNHFRNLLTENGSWGFERITTAPIATDFLDGQVWNWIDYDNDGDFDAYETNYNNPLPNKLYRNDGGAYVAMTEGQVGPIVGGTAAGLANLWADFDNDADLDCLVTNDGSAACDYYWNDGDGTFTKDLASVLATENGPHYGVTAGDYDRDGDLDLYIQGNTDTKRLYRNDLANGNAWIEIALAGAGAPGGSNRSALGARVRAVATIDGSPVRQVREVSAQNSFNSMSMLDVHFGLGSAAVLDTLEVTWPVGGVEVFVNVPLNRRMRIEEGVGATDGAMVLEPTHGLLLLPNRPNPFSGGTELAFELPRAAHARLVVHDVAGRTVRTLLDEECTAGRHALRWDAKDDTGSDAASGVYFLTLQLTGGSWDPSGAPRSAATRKVIRTR